MSERTKLSIIAFFLCLAIAFYVNPAKAQTIVEKLPSVISGQVEVATTTLKNGTYEAVAQPLVAHLGKNNEGKDLTNTGEVVDLTISVADGAMTFSTAQLMPGEYLIRIAPDVSMELVNSITDTEERKKFYDTFIHQTKHFKISIL